MELSPAATVLDDTVALYAETQVRIFDDATLASLPDYEALTEQAFTEGLGELFDDLDVVRCVKKEEIAGVPLLILYWIFKESTYSQWDKPYVIVLAKLADESIVAFSDGSTGIMQQLLSITVRREKAGKSVSERQAMLSVPGGLVSSTYNSRETGQPATTWRLSHGDPAVLKRYREMIRRAQENSSTD